MTKKNKELRTVADANIGTYYITSVTDSFPLIHYSVAMQLLYIILKVKK